jgi:hypothetical protein
MHHRGLLVAGPLSASLVALAACSHGGGSTGSGTGASGIVDAGGKIVLACAVPASPPSKGSCVVVPISDAGELDAGLDDAGNAAMTTCNPITNAGCTGADVCTLDSAGMYFVCASAGAPNVAACGACGPASMSCKAGELCFVTDPGSMMANCAQLCCTDADCGTGRCESATFGLPSGVGLCVVG